MSHRASRRTRSLPAAFATVLALVAFVGVPLALANNTAQTPPFSQNWTNTGLITANDDWSGVPGIIGCRGDGLTGATAVDPQTVVASDTPCVVDVNVGQAPTFATGGVAEFDGLANPVVAVQGSGTARAPYLLIHLDTTGQSCINVSYNLRDVDTNDNAVQPVALQFRVGNSGPFTNVPAGFVADATTGPALATLVTPVSANLPAAANNQSLVQVRIITTDAVGSDEWVGIDDISITSGGACEAAPAVSTTIPANSATGVAVNSDITINFSEPVNVTGSWFDITCATSGVHTAVSSASPASSFTLNPNSDFVNNEVCTVTVYAANVTDVDTDDGPDNMDANYVFSFTTVAPPPPLPSLVINEIDYDQVGTDTGEFVEIKNTGASPVNLSGLEMRFVNGNLGGAAIYKTLALPNVNVAAGAYFVVCGDAANTPHCDLDTTPNTDLIQNGSPDAVALAVTSSGTIIDTVSYEGNTGAPYTEGTGVALAAADSTSIAFIGLSRFADGADTNDNNADLSIRCITPGRPNLAANSGCQDPRPPKLVINEVDYDQPGTDGAEFIEIYNTGATAADLSLASLELVNGNLGGAAVYQPIALSGSLAGGAYFVVCANAATVVGCDLDVSPDTNLIQNGPPDAIGLKYDGILVDAVSYEGDTGAPYTEGSGAGLDDDGVAANIGISRFPNGGDTDVNNVNFVDACITPGFANSSATTGCTAFGPAYEIHQIQGSGLASPYVGQGLATLDNVVTALAVDGFFMQTPDARADADATTSQGIFVFTGGAPTVAVGDQVDVGGQVTEFFGFTEIGGFPAIFVDSSGSPLPAAVAFDGATPSPDPTAPSCGTLGTAAENNFECFEAMRVSVASGSVGTGNQFFGSDPIAEVFVTAGQRAFRAPGVNYPGLVAYPTIPVYDANPEVFELDPDRVGLPNIEIYGGSTFSAEGVIGFDFGGYELFPTSLSILTSPVLPGAVRSRAAGEMTVGSLNMFRFFDSVNDPPSLDAQGGTRNDDGDTVSAAEYQRRRDKFVRYIVDVLGAPDVVGVQEAEKLEVLQTLAADITAYDAGVVYTAYLVEGNDLGTIDSGVLVRDTVAVDAVTQLGYSETSTWDGNILHDRPPLLLEGRFTGNGAPFKFAVMVIHNRSLNGVEDTGATGGRVRQKRYEQAQSIAAKVQAFQTAPANAGTPLILVGDFNAFEFTDGYVHAVGHIKGSFDPTQELICQPGQGSGGGTNACADLVNPDLKDQVLSVTPTDRYSYTFDGAAQVLDHALTSVPADYWLRGFEFGRADADAPENEINDASNALYASDHDGFTLFLMTDSDGDGVADDLDVCSGTVIPEATVPSRQLQSGSWALVDNDTIFDTGSRRGGGGGVQRTFTIKDTGGCSCEQIIQRANLGIGHQRNGCSTSAMEAWINSLNP